MPFYYSVPAIISVTADRVRADSAVETDPLALLPMIGGFSHREFKTADFFTCDGMVADG